jgi:hypothetical protein
MVQRRPGETSFHRSVRWVLVIALVAVSLALLFALRALERAKAKNVELQVWQTSVLRQLESVGSGPNRLKSDGLTADEGPEALADLIASRDTALEMLSVASSDGVGAPTRLPHGLRPAEKPRRSSSNTIPKLLERSSTGRAADDVAAVESDSQAPWAGWK